MNALLFTLVTTTLITLYCLYKRYMEQQASLKEYIDRHFDNAVKKHNALEKSNQAVDDKLYAAVLSLEKAMQSQEGMERVTIKALEERINILEQKIEILKNAKKGGAVQRKSIDNLTSEVPYQEDVLTLSLTPRT